MNAVIAAPLAPEIQHNLSRFRLQHVQPNPARTASMRRSPPGRWWPRPAHRTLARRGGHAARSTPLIPRQQFP